MSRAYYLYADKQTKTLNELRVSVFNLGFVPDPDSLSVTYGGLSYSKWILFGNELHLVHDDPYSWFPFYDAKSSDPQDLAWMEAGYLGRPETEIQISYTYQSWNSSAKEFDSTAITETVNVRDDEQHCYYKFFGEVGIDTVPGPSTDDPLEIHESSNFYGQDRLYPYAPQIGPVVITDEDVFYGDQRGHTNEFSVSPETGELTFSPEYNLLYNPAFQVVGDSSQSLSWYKITSSGQSQALLTSTLDTSAVYGNKTVTIDSPEGLYQTARLKEPNIHNFSFYAQSEGGIGTARVVVNMLDVNNNYIDGSGNIISSAWSEGVQTYTATTEVSTNQWSRHNFVIGDDSDYYSDIGTVLGPISGSTDKFEIRVYTSTNTLKIDACQLSPGGDLPSFLGIPGRSTLEFEGAPAAVYVTSPSDNEWGKSRGFNDVDVNPLTSRIHSGFLAFQEMGSQGFNEITDDNFWSGIDYHLGKGGSPWRTTTGISDNVFGRKNLPYAQTSGIQKLYERQSFHRQGWEAQDEIYIPPAQVIPSDVYPIIPENTYQASSGALHVVVGVSDNVVLRAQWYDGFGNVVPKLKHDIDHASNSGTYSADLIADISGLSSYTWTRRGTNFGVGVETVTFSYGSLTNEFKIDVVE